MQSISSTSANKTPATEKVGEAKATEEAKAIEEAKNVESKAGQDKIPDFASVLDAVSSGEEVESIPEEAVGVEKLLPEGAVSKHDVVDEDTNVAFLSTFKESSQDNGNLGEASPQECDVSLQESDVSLQESDVSLQEGDVSLQEGEKTINPIIVQIESAQKTDTRVNDSKANEGKSNVMLQDSAIGSKDSKQQNAVKLSSQVSKQKFENVLSDGSLAKDFSAQDSLVANNKLEAMVSSLNSDVNKPVFNQNAESNMLHSLTGSNANIDRPLQQVASTSVQSLLQSGALQQPLELQSKHASAMIGERILMMLNQGKQEVTIRLDPAELGSLQIKLHVQQDQLQVVIQTQVGQSRDIIEQNLPRLREQLAQQGINLGEASVEQQSQQNQSSSQGSERSVSSRQNTGRGNEALVDSQSEWLTTQIPLSAQGIDYYA